MASSILSSLLSKPSTTFAFMDGTPILQNVKIVRVAVQLAATLPRHKLERGSSMSDVRIVQPLSIAVQVICPTLNDAESVIAFMNDRFSLYKLTSKGLLFQNLMAQSISVKQDAAMLSAAPFRIYLKEILLDQAARTTVAQPTDSSLLDRGIELLNSTTQTVTGLFTSVTKSVSNTVSSLTGN